MPTDHSGWFENSPIRFRICESRLLQLHHFLLKMKMKIFRLLLQDDEVKTGK